MERSDKVVVEIPAPPDIGAGPHQVVVIEERRLVESSIDEVNGNEPLPVHDLGPWPQGLSLRREDLYDDWGRLGGAVAVYP